MGAGMFLSPMGFNENRYSTRKLYRHPVASQRPDIVTDTSSLLTSLRAVLDVLGPKYWRSNECASEWCVVTTQKQGLPVSPSYLLLFPKLVEPRDKLPLGAHKHHPHSICSPYRAKLNPAAPVVAKLGLDILNAMEASRVDERTGRRGSGALKASKHTP